jgi:hypothetical protein
MTLKIGTPCHFRPSNRNVSACGIVNPKLAAYDARDVNCFRCMKTKKYKVYMNVRLHIRIEGARNMITRIPHCNFCGKLYREEAKAMHFIVGKDGAIICDSCVKECMTIVKEKKEKKKTTKQEKGSWKS